jgi:large subunit ribosomal protein L32
VENFVMPVPKRKRSKARRDKRFANKGIKPKQIASCQQCKSPTAAHQVCKECGFYKGVKVLATKVERSLKRAEVQQAKAKKSGSSEKSESEE